MDLLDSIDLLRSLSTINTGIRIATIVIVLISYLVPIVQLGAQGAAWTIRPPAPRMPPCAHTLRRTQCSCSALFSWFDWCAERCFQAPPRFRSALRSSSRRASARTCSAKCFAAPRAPTSRHRLQRLRCWRLTSRIMLAA